jgi:hypothetical protein
MVFGSENWSGFKLPEVTDCSTKVDISFDYMIKYNGDKLKDHIWSDEIGSQDSNFYKSHTTNGYESKYGTKYSPNRKSTYYRDKKPKRESLGTREKDRVLLFKILKENGLK